MIKNKNIIKGSTDIMVPAKLNLGEFIVEKIWRFRDKVCLFNAATEETITYGQIAQQSMNLAVSLTRIGVRKGHTIALISESRPEFFPTVIGAVCAGAVLTTANIGYTKGELTHVLNISKPQIVFLSPLTYKTHIKTIKSLKFVKKIIVFEMATPGTIPYENLALPKSNSETNELFNVGSNVLLRNVRFDEFEAVDVQGQVDTAFILYSSGTTGLPKGVMLTHYNVIVACVLPASHNPQESVLTITPWFHVMGLVGNITAMAYGRTGYYLPKFDIQLFLRTIEKYKIPQLTVVPPVLVAICKTDSKYDLSSVKLVYSGAAPLHNDTVQAIKIKFPNAVTLQGYGMSEVTLAVTRDTMDLAHFSKPGGVGRVVAGSTVKVVDIETRQPVGANKKGEICVKGPLLMKGYVGKDMKDEIDDEGYFKTGDIGFYDEDGCFFVVDRLKELIKYKGYQVPPAEIEAVLLQHPAVVDAGVVGKPDGSAGEVPVAFVVKLPGAELSEDDVKKFVAERLSNPKHLRGGVRFINAIPKNPSGKILRKTMRSMIKSEKSKL